MNFKEQLVDSGRIVGEMVAANVGNNPEYYKQIVDMTLYEKMPMQSRAGRVLYLCAEKYPYLFPPHIDRVLEHAQKGNILHRAFLYIFAEMDLPMTEDQEGILLDLSFQWLNERELEVAHIIFCFTYIFKIVKKEPELAPELAETIKRIIPHSTAGVKNRGGRILMEMKKLEMI